MEYSQRALDWIYVASDAHFRKTHDIDTLVYACLKMGVDYGQILVNSAFFTAHLDQANGDSLHLKTL
jgi:hypothetical protein